MASGRGSRRTVLVGGAIVIVLGVAIGTAIAVSGSSSGTSSRIVTGVARRGNLAQTVDASFTLNLAGNSTVALPTAGTTVPSAGGVVTNVSLSVGQTLPTLQPLASINGNPVFGIPSSVPLFRDLVAGDFGSDVQALQDALNATGFSTAGDTAAVFGGNTLNALEQWQASHLVPQTGTAALSFFTSFPPHSVVISLSAADGQKVAPGAAIATVGDPGQLVAQADVAQSDVSSVKQLQPVQLNFDAMSGSAESGLVESLPAQAEPSSTGATAGNSTPVQYMVTIALGSLPAGARAGMTGQAHIAVQSRSNVVIVPSAAVGGTTDQPTVQVLVGGRPVTRPVVVGLVTSADTEILTGVQPGDVVVVGRQQLGAAPSTAPVTGLGGTGTGRGGGGLGGGGLGGGGRGTGG